MAEPLPDNLEGFLYKKGEFSLIGSPKWKKRWFKQEQQKLMYYEKGSKKEAGFIDLSEVTKVTKSSSPGPLGALNGFKLVTPTREWELQADSDRDALYWMDGLVRVVSIYNAVQPKSPHPDIKRATSPKPERAVSPLPNNRTAPAQSPSSRPTSPTPSKRPLSPLPLRAPSVQSAISTDETEAALPDSFKTLLNSMPLLSTLPKPISNQASAATPAVTSWQPRCIAPEARRIVLPGMSDLSSSLSLTKSTDTPLLGIQTSPRSSRPAVPPSATASPASTARLPMSSVSGNTVSSSGSSSASASPMATQAQQQQGGFAVPGAEMMTSLMKESLAVTEAMWHGTVDLMMAPVRPFMPADSVKPPERSVLDDNPESPLCSQNPAGSEEGADQLMCKSQLQQVFELPVDSELVDSYYCGYYTGNFYQRGIFYIFSCHICYTGRYALSGVSNTEKISYKEIANIERKNTALVLPNGIEVEVKGGKKYFFGGFLRPHVVFDNIERLWKDHTALCQHPIANKPAKEKLNQLKFQERFGLGPQATLITQMSCAFYRVVYHVGQLYLSKGHVCFRAKAASLAGEIKEVIPFTEIVAVERRNSAIVIPNAIEIVTRHTAYVLNMFDYLAMSNVIPFTSRYAITQMTGAVPGPIVLTLLRSIFARFNMFKEAEYIGRYFFSSFLKRDQTADLLTNLWRQHGVESMLGSEAAMRRIRPAGPTAGQQTQAEARKEVLVSKGSANDQALFQRASREEPGQVLLYHTRCTLTKGNVKQPTAGHVFVALENIYFLPDTPANAAGEKMPMKEVVAMERRPHAGIKIITTVTRYLMIHFADRDATYDEFVKAWNRKRSAVRLFGATLAAGTYFAFILCVLAVLAKDPSGLQVPAVLQRCITVLTEKGVKQDGIFRAVPTQAEVAELRQKMEEAVGSDIDLSRFGVHVIATALKAFLKDSPEPLLGWQDAQLANSSGTAVEKLTARLKTLPKENRAFLRELGKLLNLIARDNPSMPSAKLALVFSPLLYPPRDANDLAQTAFAQELVRAYVDGALTLFPK